MQNKFLYRFLLIAVLFSATPLKAQMTLYNARDIYMAASDGNTVSLYYSQNNINVADSNGNTALCMAYQNGDWKSYSLLMRYGASANVSCMRAAYVYREPVAATTTTQTSTAAAGTSVMSGTATGSSSGTFLGMGAVGWTTVGVLAAGGITAAALGGGGGGGGSNKCKNVNCGEHGTCNAGQCVCETGYIGTACENCASGYVKQDGACYKEIGGCTKYNPSTGYCTQCEDYNTYYLNEGICELRTNKTDCAGFVETADQCTGCLHTGDYYYSNYTCNPRQNKDGCTQFNPNADICTYCEVSTHYLSGGSCHERTNKEGCTGFDSKADQCTGCDADHYLKNGVCLVRQNKDNCLDYQADDDICLECTDITKHYLDNGKCTPRTNTSGCHEFVKEKDQCKSCINETQYDLIDGMCVARTACTQLDPFYVTGDSKICTGGLYVCTFAEELADGTKCYTYTPNDCSSYHATSSEGCTSYTDCKNPDGTFYQCTSCDTETGWVHTADNTCEPKDCSPYVQSCPAGYKPTEVKCIAGGKSYYSCEIINNGKEENTDTEAGTPKVTYGYSNDTYAAMAVLEANQNIYNAAGTVDKNNTYSADNSVLTVANKDYSVPVYGMYVESETPTSNYTVYNAYSKEEGKESKGFIEIEQKETPYKVVGMAVDNGATSSNVTVVNAGDNSQGTISVSYTGTGTANVYGIETKGRAINNNNGTVGTIEAANAGSGDTFGIFAKSGANTYATDESATGWIILGDGGKGTGNIYGMFITGIPSETSPINAYNVMGSGTGYITSFAKQNTSDEDYISSLLTATHQKVYGMYAPNGATLINAQNDQGYDTNATIALTVNASEELHGMYSAGQAYNAMSDSSTKKANASIIISNTNKDNGVTYGISAGDSESSLVYNATGDGLGKNSSVTGKVDVSSSSSGMVIGLKGADTRNTFVTDSDESSSIDGTIKVKALGGGNAYGMNATKSAQNVYNTNGGTATGTIEVTHEGSGEAYGISALSGANVDSNKGSSTGWIILGDGGKGTGDIYGMFITGTPSETSPVNAYNVMGSGTGYITSFAKQNPSDEDYTSSLLTATHQKVYGMYAPNGATLYNAWDDYNVTGLIALKANASDGLYGMSTSTGTAYNAYTEYNNAVNVSIILNNTVSEDGGTYGMYSDSGTIYNAFGSGATGQINVTSSVNNNRIDGIHSNSGIIYNASGSGAKGQISVTTTGKSDDSDGAGISGNTIYNAYNGGIGTITIDADGWSYGIYGTEVYNAYGANSTGSILSVADVNAKGIYTTSTASNGYKGGNGTIRVGSGTADTVSAYGIYSVLKSGTISLYNAYEGTGLITDKDADNNVLLSDNSNVYGIYGTGSTVKAYNAYADDDEEADATGDIILKTTGNAEMIGIYAKGTESNEVRNAYNNENGKVTGTITLSSTNNGEAIYGIKVESNTSQDKSVDDYDTVYNAAMDSNTYDRPTGNINIASTGGSGNVFGMCVSGNATATNAYYGTGKINITSSSTGTVYGMKGDKDITNAASGGKGDINVTVELDRNTEHKYLYGIYAGVTATNANAGSQGNITVKGVSDKANEGFPIYGMYSLGTAYNANGNEAIGNITVEDTGDHHATGIYTASEAYNGYEGGNGTIILKGDSNLSSFYGIEGEASSGSVTLRNAQNGTGTITNLNESTILTNDSNYIYGIYGRNTGGSVNIVNSFATSQTSEATIELATSDGEQPIYGIYGYSESMDERAFWLVNAFKDEVGESVTSKGNIILSTSSANTPLFGIWGHGQGNVTNADTGSTGNIELNINNTSSNQSATGLYSEGMKSDYSSDIFIYNANTSAIGDITITSNGKGDIYGIHSTDRVAYNAVNAGANGTITLTTNGEGDAYGMYNTSTYATYNSMGGGTGTINVTSNSSGAAVGMYTASGNLYNSNSYNLNSKIDVTSNSSGSAYGMWQENAQVMRNYGDITVKANGAGEGYGMNRNLTSGTTAATRMFNYGRITVTGSSSGNVYGMHTIKEAELKNGSTAGSEINVTSTGSDDAYGMYAESGNVYNGYVDGSSTYNANINVTSNGSGDAYGMYAKSGNIYNGVSGQTADSIITVTSTGSGDAYGMYSTGNGNVQNNGKITINTKQANAYGIYYEGSGTVTNNGVISITDTSGYTDYDEFELYGIYSKNNGTVINNGLIEIQGDNSDSVAIGIYAGEGSTVTNNGLIVIGGHGEINTSETGDKYYMPVDDAPEGYTQFYSSYGIYSLGNVEMADSDYGSIALFADYRDGQNVGIYTSNRDNVDIDRGYSDIYIDLKISYPTWLHVYSNGTEQADTRDCDDDGDCWWDNYGSYYYIYVDDTPEPRSAPAKLANNSIITSSQPLNFVTEGNGTVLSMPNAVWQAPAIKGNITMSSEIVDEGFETTYQTTDTFDVADLSNLNLLSQSALFNASLDSNQTDVTLTMKEFSDVVENKELASFLSENYTLKNNEEMFSQVKSIETASGLNKSLNQMFGKDVFSRFMFEDLTMMREMNFDMNNKLFSNDKDYFETAGSVTPFAFDGNSGSNGRYSLTSNSYGNKSIGISAAFSDIRSDDGDLHNSNHRKETSFVVSLPMGYKTHGFHLISTPKLGYAYGTYERKGFEGATYDGTLQKRIYALTNEVRYPVKLGSWTLSPSIEANFIGYQMKGHEDEDGASPLVIPNQERYSLASGFGLYATREVEFLENGKLSFNIGGSVYHEFLDPYEMKLGVRKMNGYVNLKDEKRGDNFGIVRTGFDFNLGDITLSGHLNSYIDNSYHSEAKLGLKYAF